MVLVEGRINPFNIIIIKKYTKMLTKRRVHHHSTELDFTWNPYNNNDDDLLYDEEGTYHG